MIETPNPGEKILLEGYGGGGFRFHGKRHEGSVILSPFEVRAWEVNHPNEITIETLEPVFELQGDCEILLLGMGKDFAMPEPELMQQLRERGMVVDSMDTGAACRTYNVLATEERRVMAALIAV